MKHLVKSGAVKKCLAFLGFTVMLFMSVTVNAYADGNDEENNKKNDDQSNEVEFQVPSSGSEDITIDGYFDDWADKPMSILTWNNNNGNAYHNVSMVKDDNYIYIYLGMHPSYHSDIPINAIFLSINDQECQMVIRYANEQNTADWDRDVKINQKGIYLGLHPFAYNPNYSLGDVAISVTNGNPRDQLEMRVSISLLEEAMGLKAGTINSGSTIKLRMPNVGDGTIELLGTSTGAVLGIALCIGAVVAVKLYRSKKARLSR